MRLLLAGLLAALPVPPFGHALAPVTAAQLPYSWHRGCPVAPAQLRRVRLSYWGFDRRAHMGAVVVNASAVGNIVRVFGRVYDARSPTPRFRPIHALLALVASSFSAGY